MFDIVKTDLIYYNTEKDFEFEFNLCGICQMRLLTEVPFSKKEFLLSLSKSVKRSKIIFIVTKLGDGFVDELSAAIGYKTIGLDENAYCIKHSPITKLPENAIPLTTDDGTLSSFVIECGVQSLIVLSEEKEQRRTIMKKYIEQYIKDVNNYQAAEKYVPAAPVTETPIPNEPEEKIEEAPVAEPEIPQISENPDITVPVSAETEEPEPEPEPVHKTQIIGEQIFPFDINEIQNEENTPAEPKEENSAKQKRPLSLFTLILIIIICFLAAFLIYSFIAEPLINGFSIAENFKDIINSLK